MGGIADVVSLEGGGKYKEIGDALLSDDIRKSTDLTDAQVSSAAYLGAMCKKYKLPLIESILTEFLNCRVSLDRGSRGEYTKVLNFLESMEVRNTRVVTKGDENGEIDSIMEAK